jgi:hypothetical protein
VRGIRLGLVRGWGRTGFPPAAVPGPAPRPLPSPRHLTRLTPARRGHRPDDTDVELVLAKAPPGAGQELLAPQIGPAPRPGLGLLVRLRRPWRRRGQRQRRRRRRGQRERRLPAARLLGLQLASGVALLLPHARGRGRAAAAAAAAQQQPERRGLRLTPGAELGLHAGQAAEEARPAAARESEAQGPAGNPPQEAGRGWGGDRVRSPAR